MHIEAELLKVRDAVFCIYAILHPLNPRNIIKINYKFYKHIYALRKGLGNPLYSIAILRFYLIMITSMKYSIMSVHTN